MSITTQGTLSSTPLRTRIGGRSGWLSGRNVAIYAFLIIVALFFLVPLYVIVVTSLKTMDEIRQGNVFQLPHKLDFSAWSFSWSQACAGLHCGGMQAGFINSVLIVVPAVVMAIGVSSVAGYALALWNVRWANGFLLLLFLCAFVPFQIIMYPLIKITATIGVYGSIFGVAVVHASLQMPILTLIFTNYYRDIPRELMSAAMVDNGRFWRIFGEIILPMSTNILIVVLIMVVTNVWNDFLVGLLFGNKDSQPMTTILNTLANSTTGTAQYNVYMASALETAIFPLVLYFVLGRFFVQGIAAGAIKG
jgi:glucose/mannose transport system permease protein